MTPRGIRNRNPGNLRKSKDKWQGLSAVQSDPEFFTFQTDAYGIRALARTLITYQDKYDLDTVRGLINRWAPLNENDTDAYVSSVARRVNVGPDDPINVHHYGPARALVEAIIRHENGSMPYSDATMREALALAGIKPPLPPVEQSRTLKAGTVAAGVTAVGMVAEPVRQLAEQVEAVAPAVQIVREWVPGWILGAVVLVAIGYMAFRYIQDRKLRVA